MCDLIPKQIWDDINSTFLEPSCGNGNFVIEILQRKLKKCINKKDVYKALKSVYAIDIMQDNIDECKDRIMQIVFEFMPQVQRRRVNNILNQNIMCGNSLDIMKKWEKKY